MMETYTLSRFYHEAKAILEKYHLSNVKDYVLRVSFDIREEEERINPKLKCTIDFDHRLYDNRAEKSVFSFGPTPASALAQFEERAKERSNHQIMDSVGVEVPEEAVGS